jgi:hypothetical protein
MIIQIAPPTTEREIGIHKQATNGITKSAHFWQINGPAIVYGTSDNRSTKFAILWQRVFGAVTVSRDRRSKAQSRFVP